MKRLLVLMLLVQTAFSGCGLLWFGAGAGTAVAIDEADDPDLD